MKRIGTKQQEVLNEIITIIKEQDNIELEEIKKLIKNKADKKAKNDDGKTALDIVENENEEVAKPLIEKDAEAMNVQDKDGKTALNETKEFGIEEVVEILGYLVATLFDIKDDYFQYHQNEEQTGIDKNLEKELKQVISKSVNFNDNNIKNQSQKSEKTEFDCNHNEEKEQETSFDDKGNTSQNSTNDLLQAQLNQLQNLSKIKSPIYNDGMNQYYEDFQKSQLTNTSKTEEEKDLSFKQIQNKQLDQLQILKIPTVKKTLAITETKESQPQLNQIKTLSNNLDSNANNKKPLKQALVG